MATAMTSSNTIEFDSARRMMLLNRELEAEPDEQLLKLKLSTVLQSSLDLEMVLQIFHDELKGIIELSGLSYIYDSVGSNVSHGKRATHSCGYRLVTQKDFLGEVTFYRSKRFTEYDLELIEELLGTLICPLKNSLRYREAVIASLTDPLTGCGNHIALDNTLQREMELAKRHKSALSLLMIDVDDFKHINDRHGHKNGDLVLQETVKALSEVNRQTDLIFRFGGEEFVVILNETNLPGALVIAERIRETVQALSIELNSNETLSLTVSIGATSLKRSDGRDSIFQRADQALYQAKENGKNQVVGI